MESWTLLISKEKTRRLRIFSNSSHTIQTEEDLWWEVHLSGFCVFSGTSINLLRVSPILLLRNGVVRQSYVDHYLRSEVSQFFFPSTLSHSVALWGANLVTMGAGNFVYSRFGHFVDLVFDWSQSWLFRHDQIMLPQLPLQRQRHLVGFYSYSPFGLLIRSRFGEGLSLKRPFLFADHADDGLVVFGFSFTVFFLGRVGIWGFIYDDERGAKCWEQLTWYRLVFYRSSGLIFCFLLHIRFKHDSFHSISITRVNSFGCNLLRVLRVVLISSFPISAQVPTTNFFHQIRRC